MLKPVLLTLTLFAISLEPGANGALLIGDLETLLSGDATTNIFITLSNGPEELLGRFTQMTFGSRNERLNSVVTALKEHSSMTQKVVVDILEKFASVSPTPIEIKPFWISNQIYVKGANRFLVALLQALGPLISFIGAERFADLIPTIPAEPTPSNPTSTGSNATWGVQKIQAEEAWAILSAAGNSKPVVIGSIDSGVRGTHEALRDNYVGGEYGWFDPGEQTATPNDQNGHGTHTVGKLVSRNPEHSTSGFNPGIKICKPRAKNHEFKRIFAKIAQILSIMVKTTKFSA